MERHHFSTCLQDAEAAPPAPQPATGAVQAPLPLPPAQAEPEEVRCLMRGSQHDILVS